jgi:hypothetical protein
VTTHSQQAKSIERKDGSGIMEITPGRDIAGQRGGKFDLLVVDETHTSRFTP